MKDPFSIFLTQDPQFPYIKFSQLLSGYAYYKNYRLNLLTQQREDVFIDHFLKECEKIKFNNPFEKPRVMHLFYELQHILYSTDVNDDCLLAIDLTYTDAEYLKEIKGGACHIKNISDVCFHDYEKKFNKGYKELLAGNCYQFNLTEKFEFSINTTDPLSIMGSLWKTPNARAPYGHASFIPSINKFYLSNSPESLFELSKKGQQFCIRTRPIKGTIANENNSNQNWKRLLKSEKDRAELYMITDLMRNDLSRIQKPNARVIKKRSRLFVPGLIHQYSLIEAFLDSTINLFEIIKSLFPGGSITGAPKKRVLEILQKLEKRDRGFYCGSTILLYKKIMASSINIRSAEINLKNNKLYYSSGGGITLLSTAEQEYQETLRKLESFTKLFV